MVMAFDEDESEPPESEMIFPDPAAQLDIWDEQLASIVSSILKKARCHEETFRIRIALYTSSDIFANNSISI